MKRLRIACLVLAFGLVVSVAAVLAGTEFAHGEGDLTARDGAQARFAFRVRQTGEEPAEGTFRFMASGPHGSTVTIHTERVNRLEVHGDHAAFGGPAVLEVSRTDHHAGFRWEGHVTVKILNDQRHHDRHNDHLIDLMEVSFVADHRDRNYGFAGWTTARSIQIGVRDGK